MNQLITLLVSNPQGASAQGQGGGMSSMLIMLLLIFVVFYFFMIRPQQKRQKKVQEFRDSLQKGAEVVTVGGIHGKIVNSDDLTFTLEIADGVKIKVEKAAIAVDENKIGKKQEEKQTVVTVDGKEK
ncbi:MAG: preprotein translocase subunit YajC [Bacteroidales bacterium]|nr:preprotein translocase subunit YajC [Bacteroidales bacterium]